MGMAALLPWLSACTGPQSIVDPAGPAARTIATLWWAMLIYATVSLLVVALLWWRGLRRRDAAPRLGSPGATRWILLGGVVWPTASVAVLLAFGMPAGHRIQALPVPDGTPHLAVDVYARQWSWTVRYPGRTITLTDELRMPAGVPVDVRVHSEDVIHSFWVPRLQGKVDAIPGRVNVLRLQADAPGELRGQCAEFCGLDHARMVLRVIVMTPDDFNQWLKDHPRP